jgi:hypothetical protein
MPGEVLLSASVPVVGRGDYFKSADPFLIQLAVRELVILLMRSGKKLIWGGHPAITPMVWAVCEDLEVRYAESIVLYQSQFFEEMYPDENQRFTNVVYVEAEPTVELSLTKMRRQMIGRRELEGAVFIGGMEGVLEELALYQELHPGQPIVPVLATGGATLDLGKELGIHDPAYSSPDFVDLFIAKLHLDRK